MRYNQLSYNITSWSLLTYNQCILLKSWYTLRQVDQSSVSYNHAVSETCSSTRQNSGVNAHSFYLRIQHEWTYMEMVNTFWSTSTNRCSGSTCLCCCVDPGRLSRNPKINISSDATSSFIHKSAEQRQQTRIASINLTQTDNTWVIFPPTSHRDTHFAL